jgi:hypothetical protein
MIPSVEKRELKELQLATTTAATARAHAQKPKQNLIETKVESPFSFPDYRFLGIN